MGLARWELGCGKPELLELRFRSVGMGRKPLGRFTGAQGSIRAEAWEQSDELGVTGFSRLQGTLSGPFGQSCIEYEKKNALA